MCKINRWVREEKDKGKVVKIRFGEVSVEGRRMRWEEIERDMRIKN